MEYQGFPHFAVARYAKGDFFCPGSAKLSGTTCCRRFPRPARAAREPLCQVLSSVFKRHAQFFVGYAVALLSTAVVALARMAGPSIGLDLQSPYLLLVVAIVISTWFGGFGPGVAATILTAGAAWFLVVPIEAGGPGPSLMDLGVYLSQGFIISWLGRSRMHTIGELRQSHEMLEERVAERTRELSALNERLHREVEERRQVNEEMRGLNQQLEVSNRELQDFASVASHDLQEPLRKIRAFGDRLARQRSGLDDDGRAYLERMLTAAGRMQSLISDLLTFSRVATRAMPFQRVNMNEVAAGVLGDLEMKIEQSGGRVELGDLPEIEADPLQMRQMLQNLIGNALKFHREGEAPVVRVEARLEGEGGMPVAEGAVPARVRLTVRDNGIGFDEKYTDRIFTIFQRLHGRDVYEGTGVGLAICRKIVERHGGSIAAKSEPGQGATFIITLPIEQARKEVPSDVFTP